MIRAALLAVLAYGAVACLPAIVVYGPNVTTWPASAWSWTGTLAFVLALIGELIAWALAR